MDDSIDEKPTCVDDGMTIFEPTVLSGCLTTDRQLLPWSHHRGIARIYAILPMRSGQLARKSSKRTSRCVK
jgi:hypothetical protein